MTSMNNDRGRETVNKAHNDLQKLGDIAVRFAGVERITCYDHGRFENDAEHSFHLSLTATELAAAYHPELDAGLVSQFATVHDLVEVYAGDVPSFNLTAAERRAKEAVEAEALKKLLDELPAHTAGLLERYETQTEPEARFVRFVDKLLPAVIASVVSDANREDFLERYGIKSLTELESGIKTEKEYLYEKFPEFDFLHLVQDLANRAVARSFFPDSKPA